jgi:hypothetical protein
MRSDFAMARMHDYPQARRERAAARVTSEPAPAPSPAGAPRHPERSERTSTAPRGERLRAFAVLRMTANACLRLSVVLVLATGSTACRTSTAAAPLAPELAGSDPDAQMEFWHALPQRRVASNDEAFHALLLFIDGSDPAPDYPARVQAMTDRKLLPAGFNGSAEQAVKRGTLAVARASAIRIKGGLSMRLFGPSPRYAVRELQYVGLFPPSSPQQTFSGQELLGIIAKAEDFQRMYNEDALAAGAASAGEATHPPRGPAEAEAVEIPATTAPAPDAEPEAAPDAEPQQP